MAQPHKQVILNVLRDELVKVNDVSISDSMEDEGGESVGRIFTILLHHYLIASKLIQQATQENSVPHNIVDD